MSKWEMVRLGDVCEISSGGTPSKSHPEYYESGTIPWVKTGDLKEKYVINYVDKISELGLNNSSAKLFPAKTVLIAMYGATIGACSILSFEACTNQACAAFLPNSEIDENYLYYFLCSKKENFVKMGIGGAQPNISATILKRVEIPLPPLAIQQKIACTLDTAAALLALRKQQLTELDGLIQSVFIEMFGDPVVNEKGWDLRLIGETTQSIIAGWSVNGESRQKKSHEKAVLKVSAVTQGIFNSKEYKVINEEQEIKKYVFPEKGDLLFSRANTRDMVGATAIVYRDYPDLLLPDKLWKIIFMDCVNVYYMKYILSTPAIRSVFSNQSTGTSGSMYNVSMVKFKNIKIPLPPIALQTQFAAIVEKIEKQKSLVQQAIDESQTLFDALMSQYFD